jgi:hypothetical protein
MQGQRQSVKIKYEIEAKCDGCGQLAKTRAHEGLDPRRPNIINNICKSCDIRADTISKILKHNQKNLPETHSFLGFPLAVKNHVKSIEISEWKTSELEKVKGNG